MKPMQFYSKVYGSFMIIEHYNAQKDKTNKG